MGGRAHRRSTVPQVTRVPVNTIFADSGHRSLRHALVRRNSIRAIRRSRPATNALQSPATAYQRHEQRAGARLTLSEQRRIHSVHAAPARFTQHLFGPRRTCWASSKRCGVVIRGAGWSHEVRRDLARCCVDRPGEPRLVRRDPSRRGSTHPVPQTQKSGAATGLPATTPLSYCGGLLLRSATTTPHHRCCTTTTSRQPWRPATSRRSPAAGRPRRRGRPGRPHRA